MNAKEKIKELVSNKEDLLVVYVGDSHTWGQGADGWLTALNPPATAGDLRKLPNDIPSFPKLYTDYLRSVRPNKITHAVNSGIGSTATNRYRDVFWVQAVENYKPDIVVIEFAINDWLPHNEVSVAEFSQNLEYMIERANAIGAVPIILTVSPVLGPLEYEGHYYPDYIEASRKVIVGRDDVILADANKLMEDYLNSGDRAETEAKLYDDCWHVAQKGQELYLEALVAATGLE